VEICPSARSVKIPVIAGFVIWLVFSHVQKGL
jgi:hypothetical protein